MKLICAAQFLGPSNHHFCEVKYGISAHIAEFYNTISNAIFLVFCAHFHLGVVGRDSKLPLRQYLLTFILALTGIGSFCFHATMSRWGQLLDQLPMIYCTMCALWSYGDMFWLRRKSSVAAKAIWFVFVFGSTVAMSLVDVCQFGFYSAFLLLFGASLIALVGMEMYACWFSSAIPLDHRRTLKRVFIRSFCIMFFAVTIWFVEFFFKARGECSQFISFFGGFIHPIWHFLTALFARDTMLIHAVVYILVVDKADLQWNDGILFPTIITTAMGESSKNTKNK